MGTLLPIDLAVTAMPAQRRLVIDPPLSDAELFQFCAANEAMRIERSRDGALLMNAPAGGYASDGNAEIAYQLRDWWKTHRRGRVFDASGGFYLADGSMLNPDAVYATPERLAAVSKQELRRFPHLCPNFVIELLSESDRPAEATQKMVRWIENGAELAWLIDPYQQKVRIFRPGIAARAYSGLRLQGVGPVDGFVLDLKEVWECYDL